MMKTIVILFTVLVPLLFLLNSCSDQVICSTPYILKEGNCCLDSDNNGECDSGSVEIEKKEIVNENKDKRETVSQPEKKVLSIVQRNVEEIKNDVADDLYLGSIKNSKVTMIVYGDYQDKFSQRLNNEVLPKILERYSDKILYIYRDFPQDEHKYSFKAAEAANCASEQDKFLEYHNLLFKNIYSLFNEDLEKYAQELNLDIEKFRNCLNFGKYMQEVKQDKQTADLVGVTILPTVFINGMKIIGLREFNVYKNIIDEFLKFDLISRLTEKKIIASATGKAYLIHKDKSVFDPIITDSPYTNNMDIIDARFSLDALDKTVDNKLLDDADFWAEVKVRKYGELTEDLYKIKFKELDKRDIYDGGVMTDLFINGFNKLGTKQLPSVFAYLLIFGNVNVYGKNNKLIFENAEFNLAVTQGLRENGLITGKVDKTDTEGYLFIKGIYSENKTAFPNQDGFLYIFWENVYFGVDSRIP